LATNRALVLADRIERSIMLIRRQRVMIDSDLAALYGVETRALVQAVHRNIERFPEDFMFLLTAQEFAHLKSQSVISSGWGGRRVPPFVFTEQGVAMLSSVLRSKRAVEVNVEIMRTFVRIRRMLASDRELAKRLAALEKKYDSQFKAVFDAIRQLMAPGSGPKRTLGRTKDNR